MTDAKGTDEEKADRTRCVDVEALEDTMEEVVETLDLAERAAGFVEATSNDADARSRAAQVRRQAEAMLDAAEENGTLRPAEDDASASTPGTMH
ncbi:hypothetical protein HL658_08040 [Azospirillum sp. RWY-5-1]|uniref:DUF4164 domain-containing protein n=1 Tax=Azospirillum oleiclasticum TaxID=2735135 RepID=A0ABX2T8S2_9PROT|nr:hypothetical protein [Azospirillum oleiclasticum]NYZ12497.1 hypothetical protein [Azospirillum oleiclasticum]NYZ19657.1 hypothetical protein [Azospirillum oleiclasticum]